MSHNITPAQGIIEARNLKAAMWANKLMTHKISNAKCKHEIAQSTSSDLTEDMEQRVRVYLKRGLVTAESFTTPIDNKLEALKKSVRSKPIKNKEYSNGSKDGLWSKKI